MPDNDFNTTLTRVSATLLPMDDIKEALLAEYDFVAGTIPAYDTDRVGGIGANRIAIAANDTDRTTVGNSLKLDGKDADEYTLSATTETVIAKEASIQSNFGSDIADLRDELYQLKLDLAKQGLTVNSLPHAGFIDLFRSNDPVHVHEVIDSASQNSINANEIVVSAQRFDQFAVGEWIAIHIKDAQRYHVCQIMSKKPDGITLVFSPSTTYAIHSGQADIYKSLGESVDGSFNFFKTADNLPGAKEMESNLTDDTFRVRRQIKEAHTGFGYTFRIPEEKRGFLYSISVQGRAYGTPGALIAYVLHDHDLENFKNPAQAKADGIILATSQTATRAASNGEGIIAFDFYNGVSYPMLTQLDEVDHTVRYAVVIETLSADNLNYYDLVFLQGRDSNGAAIDLQLNNITYGYAQQADSSVNAAFTTDSSINSADLYYEIITRPIVNNGFVPHREGIYTAKFRTEKPIEISQARVTMRIGREGYFCSNNTQAGAYPAGYSFPFKKEAWTNGYDMMDLAGVGLNATDYVVIGNEFRSVSSQNASELVLQSGMYANNTNLPVYRCGYDLTLRAYREEFNATTQAPMITDSAVIVLPFTAVIPDRKKRSEKISDRLLFEADLFTGDTVKRFNRFELQIHWKTGFNSVYEDDLYKIDLVGRIHDLVVALERGA